MANGRQLSNADWICSSRLGRRQKRSNVSLASLLSVRRRHDQRDTLRRIGFRSERKTSDPLLDQQRDLILLLLLSLHLHIDRHSTCRKTAMVSLRYDSVAPISLVPSWRRLPKAKSSSNEKTNLLILAILFFFFICLTTHERGQLTNIFSPRFR